LSAATSKPQSTTLFAAGCASATTMSAVMAPASAIVTFIFSEARPASDRSSRVSLAFACCASVICMDVSATTAPSARRRPAALPQSLVTVLGQVMASQSTPASCSKV